eukprot:7654122-Lingulodinium_polyedra.AAC.1
MQPALYGPSWQEGRWWKRWRPSGRAMPPAPIVGRPPRAWRTGCGSAWRGRASGPQRWPRARCRA